MTDNTKRIPIKLALIIGEDQVSIDLRACWSLDQKLVEDLEKYHQIDATYELLACLADTITNEIEDAELVRRLLAKFGEMKKND